MKYFGHWSVIRPTNQMPFGVKTGFVFWSLSLVSSADRRAFFHWELIIPAKLNIFNVCLQNKKQIIPTQRVWIVFAEIEMRVLFLCTGNSCRFLISVTSCHINIQHVFGNIAKGTKDLRVECTYQTSLGHITNLQILDQPSTKKAQPNISIEILTKLQLQILIET